MSPAWEPVAVKGCLTLRVLTRRKALAQGIILRPACEYLLSLYPDGDDEPVHVNCRDLARVLSFIKEMAPRSVEFDVMPDEVDPALLELVERGAAEGGRIQ